MRTKKVKPPPKKYEYKLIITRELDEVKNKEFIGFRLQTTKEFLTFRYDLKAKIDVEANNIIINILGFSAPVGDLSNYGVAENLFKFYDFKNGIYDVQIERNDSEKMNFQLKIQKSDKKSISIKNNPDVSFIEIVTQ